jgi:uncharacterized protein YaiI (UPF0178 family)
MKSVIAFKTVALVVSLICLLLSTSVVLAQDDMDDEVAESTIRLMGAAEAELPAAVTKDIKLPASLSVNSRAVENASRGQQQAQENRGRREQGLSKADEAREKGKEISEQANQSRENRSRFEEPPGRPDELPEMPDRPTGPPEGS